MALIAADRDCRVNCSIAICNKSEAGREIIQSARNHRDRKMKPTETEFSTDGLPKAFLHSLRTLFDILDDGKKGYVHISEIESRWQGADTQDLPGGVLECLRRVAPPHGYLTFERFVAGLRYSMLNPDNGHLKPRSGIPQRQPHLHSTGQKQGPPQPRQAPGVKSQGCAPGARTVESNVRPLGPSNAVNTQQNRARHEDSNPACQGEWGPTTAPSVTTRYSNAGYDRTGRSLERIPVVPESGPHAVDSVRNGKQPQQGPSRSKVRSIESLALESPQIHKGSKFCAERAFCFLIPGNYIRGTSAHLRYIGRTLCKINFTPSQSDNACQKMKGADSTVLKGAWHPLGALTLDCGWGGWINKKALSIPHVQRGQALVAFPWTQISSLYACSCTAEVAVVCWLGK